jgi:uncharacterized DUF497 family protein
VDFEWDEQKSAWTLKNRGFDFAFASRIFEAPVLERLDARSEYGESRVQAIGAVEQDVLFVVYTNRDGLRRIISARRANKRERELWLSFAGP